MIGQLATHAITANETLVDVAPAYGLGYMELVSANPSVDPWLPPAGAQVTIPAAHLLPDAPRRGIVINLADQRLYHFPPGGPPQSYAVGIGRDGLETPRGVTRVVRKQTRPTWFPTARARTDDPTLPAAIPPGADNPLGSHALYLGWDKYLIHGTNKPFGVGRRLSRGCLRLYNEDIARLYATAPVGTEVRVIDQPIKAGWSRGQLFIEAHPSRRQAAELEAKGRFTPHPVDVRAIVLKRAGSPAPAIDWQAVDRAVQERRGVPVVVATAPVVAPAAPLPAAAPAPLPVPVARPTMTVCAVAPATGGPAANCPG
jgi:L,D-transpeptidase ErfK/SrfK